ncbi:MAG: hypothetical protein ACR2MA_00085 [Egibacteraceae bacterium]
MGRLEIPPELVADWGYELEPPTPLAVRGATSAWQTRYGYDAEDGTGVHGVWITLADRSSPGSVALQLTSVEPLPPQLLADLVAGLELSAPASPPPSRGAPQAEGS